MTDLLKRLKTPAKLPKLKLTEGHSELLRLISSGIHTVLVRTRGMDLPTRWQTTWDLVELGLVHNMRSEHKDDKIVYYFAPTQKGAGHDK